MSDAKLHAFPFVLVRTPLQSVQDAYKIPSEIPPIFQEGLYLSSPEFWQELQKAGENAFNIGKIKQSFYKYWIRSATRCTPFGTFAGCFLATITDEATNFVLKDKQEHARYLRLDMNYMANIISAISKTSPIIDQLKLSPNNSIYYLPDSIRYAEYTIQNNMRQYHLASVQKASYLVAVLEKAATKGGATIAELSSLITQIEDVTEEEATTFILDLWQSQILVSELEPAVTGKEPLYRFIEQLSSYKGVDDLITTLKNIQFLLEHPQPGIDYYQGIENNLKSLPFSLTSPKNTLQTDLFLATEHSRINKPLVESILAQVSDLLALARLNTNPDLATFKAKFNSRYGDSEVPLNIVLDTDIGIGYAGVTPDISGSGELVEDISYKTEQQNNPGEDYIAQYVLSKYHDYLKNQKSIIEIEQEDLRRLLDQTGQMSFSGSMYLFGALLKKEGKIDPDNFIFDLASFGGTSGGNLMARFNYGDARIFEATKEILKRQESEHPDIIFAEIVHLPQARIGNVLLRPVLREYEIPYIGKSGASPDKQIAVDDLMVSIKNNEIIIRSRRLNKRIMPRLTTAHNFGMNSLPIYKLLCDLQMQNLSFPNAWDWGSLNDAKYLPRVVYKNIVLRKARWRIDETDIKDDDFASIRDKLNIPVQVSYKEGDNELLLDFNEEIGLSLFTHYLKRFKKIQIEEVLIDRHNCIVIDVNGHPFANEIIIPVRYQKTPDKRQLNFADVNGERAKNPPVKRKFSIYSEWLYFKIYCGPKMAENLLSGVLSGFIEAEATRQLFDYFFFIRYRDEGGHHLRLRFFNKDLTNQLSLVKEVMQALQPFIDNGSIENVLLDSYSRETERYGETLIEQTEQLFYNDSVAIIKLIGLLTDSGDPEKYRPLIALRGVDALLSDFNFSIAEKVLLLKQMAASYFAEFGGGLPLQRQLSNKYRKYQQTIFSHMDTGQDTKNEIEEAVSILKFRSSQNAPIIKDIMSISSPHHQQGLYDLLQSYIHMFINRLFVASQRKYELVIYHFLDRYYHSQVAIDKKNGKG